MVQGRIIPDICQPRMPIKSGSIGGDRVALTFMGKLSAVRVRVSMEENAECCR